MKRALWIAIVLSLIFQSCQEKSGKVGTSFFEKTGEVDVTNVTDQYPRLATSLTNGVFKANDLVATLPKEDSAIRVYSIFRDSVVNSVPLDSVFAKIHSNYFYITGYYFQSPDSIYVTPREDKIYLLNAAGEILDSLKVADTVNSTRLNITGFDVHPYKREGRFYLSNQYTNYSYASDTVVRRKYFNTPLESVIDAKTGERISTNLSFPSFYRNGNFYRSSNVYRAVNEQKNMRVYSFHYSDSIYVVKDNSTKAYFAGSQYFEHPDPYDGDSIRNRAYWKEFATVNGKFLDIYHDPYRDLYYRILKHPVPVEAGNGQINTPIHAKYSLIVLNDAFQKIYEQIFESKIYFYYEDLIITKEGILLPLHPENPRNKIGEWNYDVFKISKNETGS